MPMAMELRLPIDVKIDCPTCGNPNHIPTKVLDEGLNIKRCSLENGGCSLPYVLFVELDLQVYAFEVMTPERNKVKSPSSAEVSHPFDQTELVTIMELARRVFSNDVLRVPYLDQMDLMEEEADSLNEMIEKYLDYQEVE